MGQYSKLIGALIGTVIPLGAAFGLDLSWFTPELGAAVAGILGPLLTFLIPNKT